MAKLMILGTAIMLSATLAAAQPRAPAGPCAGDIKAKCGDVQPGQGRIRACMKQHFAELSEACQARLLKAAAISKACAADVKQHCAGVKPGGGRIELCLKKVVADLSDACKDAVSEPGPDRS